MAPWNEDNFNLIFNHANKFSLYMWNFYIIFILIQMPSIFKPVWKTVNMQKAIQLSL